VQWIHKIAKANDIPKLYRYKTILKHTNIINDTTRMAMYSKPLQHVKTKEK